MYQYSKGEEMESLGNSFIVNLFLQGKKGQDLVYSRDLILKCQSRFDWVSNFTKASWLDFLKLENLLLKTSSMAQSAGLSN